MIDFDPQTFRQGYGEFDAFTNLIEHGINIKDFPDNRISFIISDNRGHYLFFESQYLVPAEKETLNAVKVDEVSLVKLKRYFFGNKCEMDYKDEITNAIIVESEDLKSLDETEQVPEPAPTKEITQKEIKETKQEIDIKPPLRPVYQRLMDVYTHKFEYVDLRFSGAQIRITEVSVPTKLLPIRNEQLRNQFKTKIRVIDKPYKLKELIELKKLEDELKELRKDFLVHSKVCNKNIIDLEDKRILKSEINRIRGKIPELNKELLKVLSEEKAKTQQRLFNEIVELVMQEPTLVFKKDSPWIDDKEHVRIKAIDLANDIFRIISWPDYFSLLDRMTIDCRFSNITIEDLYDEKLQKELKEAGLISEADVNQLANIRKGVEMKEKKPDDNQGKLF